MGAGADCTQLDRGRRWAHLMTASCQPRLHATHGTRECPQPSHTHTHTYTCTCVTTATYTRIHMQITHRYVRTLGDPHAIRQWSALLKEVQDEHSSVRQCDKEARGMRVYDSVARSNSYPEVGGLWESVWCGRAVAHGRLWHARVLIGAGRHGCQLMCKHLNVCQHLTTSVRQILCPGIADERPSWLGGLR